VSKENGAPDGGDERAQGGLFESFFLGGFECSYQSLEDGHGPPHASGEPADRSDRAQIQ